MPDGKAKIGVVLFIQGVIALGLAVVADRLAGIISLRLPELFSEPNIWLLAGCLVALSAITGFFSLSVPRGPDNLLAGGATAPSLPTSNKPFAQPRPPIVWLLPFAVALGAGIALLAILFTPSFIVEPLWRSNGYEIITWATGTSVMVALVRSKHYRKILLILVFAFGYALGATTVILFVRFEENDLTSTILGWLLSMLATGIFLCIPEIQRLMVSRKNGG